MLAFNQAGLDHKIGEIEENNESIEATLEKVTSKTDKQQAEEERTLTRSTKKMEDLEKSGAKALEDIDAIYESREAKVDAVSQKLHDFCSPLYELLEKQQDAILSNKPNREERELDQLRIELEEARLQQSEDKEALTQDLLRDEHEKFRQQLMGAIVRMQSQFSQRELAAKDRFRVEEHRLRQQVEQEILARMEGARKVVRESKRAVEVNNIFKNVPTSKLHLLASEEAAIAGAVPEHIETQTEARVVHSIEIDATPQVDDLQRKALVTYYDMHCQQRNVNVMMLVWRWRAKQKQEHAVARAVVEAIRDTKATETMVHAKTTIRLRQQLREAEEQVRRLEIIVRDDRQFFANLAKEESEAERKSDLERCVKLSRKGTEAMREVKKLLPANESNLINLTAMARMREMVKAAADIVDLDGEMDLEEVFNPNTE